MHVEDYSRYGYRKNTGSIWQQRGPWFITTFVGGLIGYAICYFTK